MELVILFVSQYSITLSRMSTLFRFSRPPSGRDLQFLFVPVENFSRIYAASPTGESVKAIPKHILFTI